MSKTERAKAERGITRRPNGDLTAHESVSVEVRAFPSAEELGEFESVLPGAADRILKTYESQVAHRQVLEKTYLGGGQLARFGGLISGLIVALAGFWLTYLLAQLNQPWLAGVIGSLDLVALVTVFVIGQNQQKAERIEKNKQTQVSELPRSRNVNTK